MKSSSDSSLALSPNRSDSQSDSDSDIYMPDTSGHVEVEQFSATREDFSNLTVGEGGGEGNKGDANVYVDSADDHRFNSQVRLTGATPIPEEILPAPGVLENDTALLNKMVSLHAMI